MTDTNFVAREQNTGSGNAHLAVGGLPVSLSNPIPVSGAAGGGGLPSASSVVIMAAQTNGSGASWTAFGNQACTALDIVNNTAVAIEYRRDGAGNGMPIPAGGSRMVIGITNANQISVRRVDQSNTPVSVQAEAFSV